MDGIFFRPFAKWKGFMMKVIDVIDKALAKVEEALAMVLMIIMLIVVTIQVVNQAFLHFNNITWTEEISRILLVWVIFIGACIATRRGSHLVVSFVYDNLKGPAKIIVRIFVLLTCIFVTAYICRSGIAMVQVQKAGKQFFGITGLPVYVASLAVPVCFAEMCLRFIMITIREVREMIVGRKKGGEVEC